MEEKTSNTPAAATPWTRRLGMALLVYSFVPLCTVELVALLPLTATQALVLGAVYVASGEIACLVAIAMLGKPFIEGVKARLKAFFLRGGQPGQPRHIGKARHYTGVGLLAVSLVPYYVVLGLLLFSPTGPSQPQGVLRLLLAGEGLFWLGLVVLGGEFWGRLKKLFEWPGAQDRSPATDASGPRGV